ncbi:MAG: 2-hydroxyacyl-CoA dehydratase subunit D [bacterium]
MELSYAVWARKMRCDSMIATIERGVEEALRSCGGPTIGWFCTYTPEEIFTALGLNSHRILGNYTHIELADAHLHSNICPYVRSSLEGALSGDYDFLDGVVIANSCDAMRRLYDAWRHYAKTPFVHILDVPHLNTESAVRYYRNRLEELVRRLEDRYDRTLRDENLASAIELHNETRELLRRLSTLRAEGNGSIQGSNLIEITNLCTRTPKAEFNAILRELLEDIPQAKSDVRGNGPRILLSGSFLPDPRIAELVEDSGGQIVADDLCVGERYFDLSIDSGGDPLLALARGYLGRTPCARMRRAERRLEGIVKSVKSLGVDGVIYHALKFCDTFLYDFPPLRRRLESERIPLLLLEGDCTGGVGQFRTRIQAFIEML